MVSKDLKFNMLYDLRCITSSENPSWTLGIEGELADIIDKFLETVDKC